MSDDRLHSPKKQPRQARSRALVDALLGALTRILNREELDRATTNAIAAQAGVSVGSLYQYFPNKEALVSLLIQRRAEADIDTVLGLFERAASMRLEQLIRQVARELIQHHRLHLGLYRVLLRTVPRLGQTSFVRDRVRTGRERFRQLLDQRRAELRDLDTDLASFVLGVSVEAVLHAAILARPELLDRPEFEQALAELCTRFLAREGEE